MTRAEDKEANVHEYDKLKTEVIMCCHADNNSVIAPLDTELIRRNHCAEKQLDVFMTTIDLY